MVAKKTAEETVAERDGAHASPAEQAPAPAESAAKKAAAKKSTTKSTTKKSTARKTTAAARKATAKKAAARKSTAEKASEKGAAAATEAARAAEQTGAHTVVAKKSASRHAAGAQATAPVPPARAAAPEELAVRPGEDPWTPEEVTEARTLLTSETLRLRSELEASGAALAGLMRDSGDGAGDDEADTGTKNITREHELSLAAHAQETLEQTERALARLEAGTYGLCEVCGKPIGKARMQAFPRATLCVEDKQKQERRG
ncbi:TraR/DksA family transcriptional regulator [Streptomyces sp. MMBL 11-1]|uniref:TraR/DksA family transcriptional regulator n=1 Tax=Streptomyces sp. MMBL 11-1 TaxID=3026420 RepID=UPI00235DCA61|nr:TraR/DksA C4-type zinc finger protein [Streptomyces sp. MMBL 11-1]